MNELLILTFILFFIWLVRNILFWTSLWQIKEYRWDRLSVHLKETEQGKNLLFSKLSILKWLALFVYGLVIFNDSLLLVFRLFVLFIYTLQVLTIFIEWMKGSFRRPKITSKTFAIFLITLCFVAILFLVPLIDQGVWIILLDRISTLFIAFIVFLLSYPTEFYHDILIEKAMKKIRKHKKLLIIGVTGSYGKSSTKEYIAQILSARFTVLKTEGSQNTPIGVAQTILKGLKKETEIFVVEMGAYKRGEIKEICEIVQPKIGVLTGISPQHESLFVSLKNIMKAKYELIESLPKNGLALFNGNNKNVVELYNQTEGKKILYKSFTGQSLEKADIKATHIKMYKTGLSFTVQKGRNQLLLKAPLLGIHSIENLLPGVFLAMHLGMKAETITTAVSNLSSLSIKRTKLSNGTVAIDSTFNASPQSVASALDYMKQYTGNKILVLPPMIELGKHANLEHHKVGLKIGSVCNYLLLTNKNYYKDITSGISEQKNKCKVAVGNPRILATLIKKISQKQDSIVAFLGKESRLVLLKLV